MLRRFAFSTLSVCLVFAAAGELFAQVDRDPRGDRTVDFWSRYGAVELEFERITFSANEDIPVRFRVSNRGYRVIRIYPSARPLSTFRFLVTNRQGQEIPVHFNSRQFNNRELGDRTVVNLQGEMVKEIVLHPGESLEKTLYLNDFYRLEAGREYRISAYFYPDQRDQYFVRSAGISRIRIDERRSDGRRDGPENVDLPDGGRTPELSPEETVYLFLSAEMRRNWKNYLKYLDLPQYITAYDRFASRYVQARGHERPDVLRSFADYLTGDPANRLVRFRIEAVEPERDGDGRVLPNGRSFVKVKATRESDGFTARYEYTYTLEPGRGRSEGFWKIIYVKAQLIR